MFRTLRLKKVHARFLESCRTLEAGRGYWDDAGPLRKWFAQLVSPVPLLALDGEGENLYKALLWLEEHCRTKDLNEELVRHYHRMLRPNSPETPGEYRRGGMAIKGSTHSPPLGAKVPMLMRQFGAAMREQQSRLDGLFSASEEDVLRTAVDLHHRLVAIHPFTDANGRVARLLMNHAMRRYGRPHIILPPLHKSPEHTSALQEADAGGLDQLCDLAKRHRIHS